MNISVSIQNSYKLHNISIITDGMNKRLVIPSKITGYGSSLNGGELLLLAIATCTCNDIYREAVKRDIDISSVDVKVDGDFIKEGEPGDNITYKVKVTSENAKTEDIEHLINDVDRIAEIHNTIRTGTRVRLIK